jgi:hypothetical protein
MAEGGSGFYRVMDERNIARQLAHLKIPFRGENINYFVDDGKIGPLLVEVHENISERSLPIFTKTMVDGYEVFFLAENQLRKSSLESEVSKNQDYSETMTNDKANNRYDENILQLLPLMMFLRYACGEHCWHPPGHYASFIIDDPWLREPYGHLSYRGLLDQMQTADFQAAIAFIPWNYDRSEPEVVELFRDHPDRFSVCVHGNNHDHYEFYKYETGSGDPWLPKSLDTQEANIKQAIARLEEFKKMTGLPYDPVMVFPHGIAPAKTLGLLKKYNFLATVNADNVPFGSDRPESLLFSLRPVTLAFENFPSLVRYNVTQKSLVDMAIDSFLGNPILLYEHHQYFADGMDAFNEAAVTINRFEPDTNWENLGYIARHLYLQRIRDDGNFDILAFCRCIELENPTEHAASYFISKEESFSFPIKQVIENGKPCLATKEEGNLGFSITIPAGGSSLIEIEYKNNLYLESIDISKNDARVNRLRKLSDLRDIKLSRNVLGRVIIKLYYDTGMYKIGLKRLAIIGFLLAILGGAGIWFLVWNIRKHRLRKKQTAQNSENYNS